jgi:hypothetical protein
VAPDRDVVHYQEMPEATSQPDVKILTLEPERTADSEWEPFNGFVVVFEAFGVKMWLGTNRREAADRMGAVLPPGWKLTLAEEVEEHKLGILGDKGGTYTIDLANTSLVEGVSLDLALEVVETAIRERIAINAPDHIFVHAGVVAYEGRALLIPGRSFSGKTTLVAALVRAGATYYSDEFAPIDKDGLVHPYAKPLSIRGDDLLQRNHDVESLGGTSGEEPVPVGAVLDATYRPGSAWRPTRLSPGQGALALLAHTVPARTRPDAVLPALKHAVEGATILTGDRGEADELAPLLLAELAAQQA